MDFTTAIKTCFSKYATFSGRASRSEYWFFFLFTFGIEFCLVLLDDLTFNIDATLNPFVIDFNVDVVLSLFGMIFYFAVFLPSLAVLVRRFHDIGKTGWWVLWFSNYGDRSVVNVDFDVRRL